MAKKCENVKSLKLIRTPQKVEIVGYEIQEVKKVRSTRVSLKTFSYANPSTHSNPNQAIQSKQMHTARLDILSSTRHAKHV